MVFSTGSMHASTSPSAADKLALALSRHQAGNLPEAEQLYLEILQVEPANAAAWHLLGVLAHQTGRQQVALDCLRRALAHNSNNALFHYSLGVVNSILRNWDEAIASYRTALSLDPGFIDVHLNLGLALTATGKTAEAVDNYRQALRVRPDSPELYNNLANALSALGLKDEAIAAYRQALRCRPDHAEAHLNLGVALLEQGKVEAAVASCRQALRLRPDYAEAHVNLGNALRRAGHGAEAIAEYQAALRLQPNSFEAHSNLGHVLKESGRAEEATAAFARALQLRPELPGRSPPAENDLSSEKSGRPELRDEQPKAEAVHLLGVLCHQAQQYQQALNFFAEALRLQPGDATFHHSLGAAHAALRHWPEAMAAYRAALRLKPDLADAHFGLGFALMTQGLLQEAIAAYRQALQHRPDLAEAWNNLANAHKALGERAEALAAYRQALRLRPDYPEAHLNLGVTLMEQGQLDEAVVCYREALRLRADFAEAHNNLGNVLKNMGLLDDALAAYRRALELQPDSASFHSNYLYLLHYHAAYDAGTLYDEHRCWNERHGAPRAAEIRPHANDRDPDRRLRLGYVSPDFNLHPVGRFLLPVVANHDREQFEIFCYSSVTAPDDVTRQFAARADSWREIAGLSDAQLAELVRQDQIDVLVDLTAHTANNRLPAFARKPAPVQVTYLAYCSTTGLSAMDYRLTDRFLDPPEAPTEFYSEETVWLPETYWCYRAHAALPPPGPLPALQSGRITFACLNNFCKATRPTLAAWRDLLRAVPAARLLLYVPAGSNRERVAAFFEGGDIERDRIEFVGYTPFGTYMRLYERIDIGLDPFPYAGGTTTCDALWMGVPVISLAGQTAVARAGLSLLSNVGLPQLVARTRDDYISLAAGLAADLPRLADLRGGLRERMQSSPLADVPRFARGLEAAFRDMWRRWCSRPSASI